MKRLIYLLILLLIVGGWLSSCRTQYIPVESVRTEYRTRDSLRHDSIYQHDSVYVTVRGDTVYQYKYKYLYKYLYVNKTDTLMKTDSIQVPYPVEKRLSRWESLKMEIGGWVFGIVVALVLIIVGWLVYKMHRKWTL